MSAAWSGSGNRTTRVKLIGIRGLPSHNFQGVAESSLPAARKLAFVIDALLLDDYGIGPLIIINRYTDDNHPQ